MTNCQWYKHKSGHSHTGLINHPLHFFFSYLALYHHQHVTVCSVGLDDQTNVEATTFPLKTLTESFDDGRTLEVTLTEHKRVVRYYADSKYGIAVALVSFHALWVL